MTRATRKPKPRPKCTVVVLDAAWPKALPGVERLVRKAVRAAIGARAGSITVALADDRRLRTLNRRDRGQDKPTNVLSYPSGEKGFLGDVVLARQTVWREAKAQRKRPREHLMHLVVHGTLHLRGFDHEADAARAERMEMQERRILAKLGIPDPYEAR